MDTKDLIILDENDREIVNKLPKVFENLMTAHSAFQIKNFILNDIDFPTIAGKYHQAVRELWSRYTNLISLSYEYKKIQSEIKLHQIKIDRYGQKRLKTEDKLDLDEIDIYVDQELLEIDHKNMRLQSIHKNGSESMREIKVFSEVLEKLDSFIGDDLRSENGLPDREKSELGFWLHKQFVAEQLYDGDRKMTPFNKILGLNSNSVPTVGIDAIGRTVFLAKNEHLKNKSLEDKNNGR